ncbi:MAG: hypothetical protein KGH79_04335 [Patescibacteria group bacterium]|nr:hypothetical protein [Patescibacteria group bacterium]
MWRNIIAVLVLVAAVLVGAYWYGQAHHTAAINDSSSVSTVINQFGSTLGKVSLTAPDAKDEIGAGYSPYVAAPLLMQWENNPVQAPGRAVSSPWPDRIQVDSMTLRQDGSYVVEGSVIEITSNEVAHGGIAAQYPVKLTLEKTGDQWLITQFERGAESTSSIGSTSSLRASSGQASTSQ